VLVQGIFHEEAGNGPKYNKHLYPLRIALVPDLDTVNGHIGVLTLESFDGFIVGKNVKDSLLEKVQTVHGASFSILLDQKKDFLHLFCTDIAVAKFTENQAHGLVVFFAHYLLNSLVVH